MIYPESSFGHLKEHLGSWVIPVLVIPSSLSHGSMCSLFILIHPGSLQHILHTSPACTLLPNSTIGLDIFVFSSRHGNNGALSRYGSFSKSPGIPQNHLFDPFFKPARQPEISHPAVENPFKTRNTGFQRPGRPPGVVRGLGQSDVLCFLGLLLQRALRPQSPHQGGAVFARVEDRRVLI